jgi:hypothetical protein
MTLAKWTEYGWLRAEPSSQDEIRGLFSVVARSLKDAHVEAISDISGSKRPLAPP